MATEQGSGIGQQPVIDLFADSAIRMEQNRFQPYRAGLQEYLSSLHSRLTPMGQIHPESHSLVETVEKNAAKFLESSDTAANFIWTPEYQRAIDRQKKELRGPCAIGLFVCIDGRLVPVLLGSPIFDISETTAGLVPVIFSPLDGGLELANPRIIEAISDRPMKDNPEMLQISVGHFDSDKPDDITCAAVLQMIERGILPNDGTHNNKFKEMLANTVEAIKETFNRSAMVNGFNQLKKVGLTASYDTRTAGFTFDGVDGGLNTTQLTHALLKSEDLAIIQRLGQPGTYRHNFTDPASLLTREHMKFSMEKVLMQQSGVFQQFVESYIGSNMDGFSEHQKQAFRFFVANRVASQITTGLYQGGDHPISTHNEQYISSSTNGLRVGQFDPNIQSFGANVANYPDSVYHLVTKVGLADQIGKMPSPYIAFISESEPPKSSASTSRDRRAKLRSHMQAVMENPDLLSRIKAGQLWLIPTILEEKTGKTKLIPNLAI